jgi:transcriptional regulator with XRE-family HTH domain
MDYISIGKRLKKARKEKGITQEKLAEELNVSVEYVNQVELGKKCFNLKRFSQIEKILDKPTCYFTEGADEYENESSNEIINMIKGLNIKTLKMIKKIIAAIIEND